jgi:hypothetical protein
MKPSVSEVRERALADTAGARAPMMLGGVVSFITAGVGYLATRRFAGDALVRLVHPPTTPAAQPVASGVES